jgi:glyoxylase-like metal-dependent hydrolase (beta-lactamase superfamily II)
MQRERVADDIYVFTSDLYAQVTAGAVVTPAGTILIDTLPFPQETLELKEMVERRLHSPVRYVVNTHYHADHTIGTCLFPDAAVVAHSACRRLLDTIGRAGLEQSQAQVPELADIFVVLPDIVLEEGCLNLHLGGKTVQLIPSPGHSQDSVIVLVPEDRVLFASDTVMPVPTLIDGDPECLINSLRLVASMPVDNVVQGHGEVILRGEINHTIDGDIRYLRTIQKKVAQLAQRGDGVDALKQISIESCGKSRIPMNGLVVDLHSANLRKLYGNIVVDRTDCR